MKHTCAVSLPALILTAALATMAGAPALAQQPTPATQPAAATTAAPGTAAAAAGVTAAPAGAATTSAAPAGAATSAAAPVLPADDRVTVPASAPPAATAADASAAPAAGSETTAAPNPARAPLGVPAAPYSNAATGGGLLQTTFALAFVIALLLGAAWLLKRFGPRGFGGGSNTVKLVGALSVGARERILVVEVGEQWIVVGASPGRMNALATMARQEAPEAAPGSQPMAAPASFADWIKHTLDKRQGGKAGPFDSGKP
ncbi:hypothetical protein ASF61_10145 [Duganella sp. Leaf126]|uniref:flagellar biosynthetic protein FliO n=1 Tax=Duganella sp. Leaf126 TaxID=1736266 RepID=UPI0006F70F60|nr:flagellar biosynthetic protein FliO [Duganella sp. Leaf126]KQQ33432.1 hypothetical protein ASF61_10145 [Duganella sp. Leaf126]